MEMIPTWVYFAWGATALFCLALGAFVGVLVYRANIKDLSRFFENIDDAANKAKQMEKDAQAQLLQSKAMQQATEVYNKVMNGGK